MSKKYRLLAILLSVLLVFSGWGGLLSEQLLAAGNDQPDLFFSEYVEGTGDNKALEIYNPCTYSVDLADCHLLISFNGGTSTETTAFQPKVDSSTVIQPGHVYVICHTDADSRIKVVANQESGNIKFNGNDAIVLKRGNTVLDRIGKVGENPGKNGWRDGSTTTTDHTLVRKSTVWRGDTDTAAGFNPSEEWTGYPVDTFSHLGSHDMDDVHCVSFFAGEGAFTDGTPLFEWVRNGQAANPPEASNILPPAGKIFDRWDEDYSNITASIDLTALYKDIPPDLFFSEYVDGGTYDKALELFNPTNVDISFSDRQYKIKFFANDNVDPTHTIQLDIDKVIKSKDVFIVVNKHSVNLKPYVENNLDQSLYQIDDCSQNSWYNGNDAIVLYRIDVNGKETVIDSIGKIGENPNANPGWSNGGVQTYRKTLVRQPWVKLGDTDPDDAFDPSLEWKQFSVGHFTNLGWHKMGIYSVRFFAGDGSFENGTVVEQEVEEGFAATPPSPSDIIPPVGFEFDGWDTDDYLNVTRPLFVTAKYKRKTYTVAFILDGKGMLAEGSPYPLTQTINHGDDAISPQVLPALGYTLIGWDKIFTNVTGNIEVNAIYEPWTTPGLFLSEYVEGSSYNKALEIYNPTAQAINLTNYKVIMHLNYNAVTDGYGGTPLTISLQGIIQPGGTFLLKHSSATGITKEAQQEEGGEWFNGNDWVVLMDESAIVDQIGIPKDNPDPHNPTGNSVVGWKMGQVQTGNRTLVRKSWVSCGLNRDDLTFFDPSVQWEVHDQDTFENLGSHQCSVVHLVTFDPNGGSFISGDLIQSVYSGWGAQAPEPKAPQGYEFSRWDTVFSNVQSSLNVKAEWKPVNYSISYQLDGGHNDGSNPETYNIESATISLKPATKTGYHFQGWYDDQLDGQKVDQIAQGSTGNLQLFAHFEARDYVVSFDSQGGSLHEPISVTFNSAYGDLPQAIREGHTFLGWYDAQSDGVAVGADTILTTPDDHTLYAQWEINSYTITFDTGGGSKIAPMTVDFGATIVPPANPVWSCCSFKGWNPALPATMPAEDLTVKALWEANAYTIIFDSAGGSFTPPLSQDFGSPISPPKDPVRTGYTFLGWEPALPDTMPMAGMELVAQWQINQYRLIFDSNGGSPLAPQVLDYGSEIKAPVNPLRLGYRFIGWEPALPDRMGAADMTVKALWKRIGVVEGEDDETPGQGTPGTEDKPGSGQGSDLDRVPITGESLPMTESLTFLGLAFLLLLAWRRRLFDLKKGKEEQA